MIHQVTKLDQLKDASEGNNFCESCVQFGVLGLISRSFSIQQPAPITQKPDMS